MRKYEFIRAGSNIYLPPVPTWLEGWNRQRWLENYFKEPDRLFTVSDMAWETLQEAHEIRVLAYHSLKFHEE